MEVQMVIKFFFYHLVKKLHLNIKLKEKITHDILDQTFGVPLEEKAKHDLKYTPQIVTKCLSCITKGFSKWSDAGKNL
jgi:hypothetical protein